VLRCTFLLALTLAVTLAVPAALAEGELTGRWRVFGVRSFLPEDDLLRLRDDTPRDQATTDLRLTWNDVRGAFDYEIALELGAAYDTAGQAYGPDRRALDLGLQQSPGADLGTAARLDRFWFGTELGAWRLTLGRQAASFGGGLVFQPMDLFNPFSPVEIDRDFKAGDDMLVLSRPFDDGSEIGLFAVGRRGEGGAIDADASSAALRWRGFLGSVSAETLLGMHLDDPLLALSFSGPVGTAVWRLDLVGQREGGELRLSGVANVDWSFVAAGRNVYLFGELYRSAFGLEEPSLAGLQAKPALRRRVERGELFVVGRDYASVGATLEWHPLVRQNLLAIHEFAGHSQLVQSTIDWRPDDSSIWQFSLVAPLGDRGDEFGRLLAGTGAEGSPLTVGGGKRLLVRWSLYF
jgi:hypothetical protein